MGRLRRLAVSGSALLLSATLAHAADMPSPMPETPVLLTVPSGWYLRGDLGAHWGTVSGAQAEPGSIVTTGDHLGSAMTASLGVGIKSSWIRTDLTIDYVAPVNYRGTVSSTDDTHAKIQATAALFNGYFDLGTWYHVTPYIGGGVGAAYVRTSDFTSTPTVTGDTGRSQWNFAWAAMAGFAFPVAHNMMVDVGYRYLDIGNVSTGSSASRVMTFKNVAAHEARVGLRWSFDELR